MATEAQDALTNSAALHSMFTDALSPLNNFYSQSIAANFQKERDLRDQAFKQAEQQRNLQSNEHLAQMAEDAAKEREDIQNKAEYKKATDIARLNFGLAQDAQTHVQAMQLRSDPNTQQIVGDLKKYPISKEGDAALVEDATQMKTPAIAEKIATGKVVTLNHSIKQTLDSLNSGAIDPVQARAALQQFTQDPTVALALTKKAGMSAQEIQAMVQSGDFATALSAIDKAANNNLWGTPQARANLYSAFANARIQAGGNSPETVAKANYLQTQLALRDKLLNSGDIQSEDAFNQIQKAASLPSATIAPKIVLPPPPGAGVLAPPPAPAPVVAPGGAAPFAGQGLIPGIGSNLSFAGVDPGPASIAAPNPLQNAVNMDAIKQFFMGGQSRFDQPGYGQQNLNLPPPVPNPGPF